jgi:hypothetical protein
MNRTGALYLLAYCVWRFASLLAAEVPQVARGKPNDDQAAIAWLLLSLSIVCEAQVSFREPHRKRYETFSCVT